MRTSTLRRFGRLVAVAVAVAAIAVALPAVAGAGAPVANDHITFTDGPYDSSACGVPGTSVDTVQEHYLELPDGSIVDNVRSTSLFTAAGTGKQMLTTASETLRSTGPIDNGDGTFSYVFANTGTLFSFRIPNGPIMKAPDGEPLRSTGFLGGEDVFDAATGDYITTRNEAFHGPHLFHDGVDVCGTPIAYLTTP